MQLQSHSLQPCRSHLVPPSPSTATCPSPEPSSLPQTPVVNGLHYHGPHLVCSIREKSELLIREIPAAALRERGEQGPGERLPGHTALSPGLGTEPPALPQLRRTARDRGARARPRCHATETRGQLTHRVLLCRRELLPEAPLLSAAAASGAPACSSPRIFTASGTLLTATLA